MGRGLKGRGASRLLPWLCLWLAGGCAPERQVFLEQAVDQATQQDIVNRFGTPISVGRLRDGREVWTFRDTGPGYSRDMGAGFCREYVLTFDDRQILRRWWRQGCVNPLR